jgi:hypothetical protein
LGRRTVSQFRQTRETHRVSAYLLLAVASTFCVACASFTDSLLASQSQVDRVPEEDNIRECIFRYRMDEYKSSGPFFLRINGKDPSDSFMARFASSKNQVKKASQSYFKKDPFPGSLRDRSTDEQGILFSVSSLSWLSPDRAEVRGGMYCGGLCADAGVYRLEKKGARWVVVEYKVEMVS